MPDTSTRPEFWTSMRSLPGRVSAGARQAEDEGWDGLCFTDSQNLSGDPYVAMATAAAATERIRLGTGVTNPRTRHAAVTAGAIACVQVESGGRAELGIGRGDSSLAHIGMAPVPPAVFEDYVHRVQRYLRGDAVELTGSPSSGAGDSSATSDRAVRSALVVADAPAESRLRWLAECGATKVPVFVVASGPKMIATAARVGDRVALALGADPDRLRWGVEAARAERPDARIAAYVHVVPHDDVAAATRLAAGGIASFARFSAMHGKVAAPAGESDREVMASVAAAYQLTHHFQGSGGQAALITPEFAQRFAVIGAVDECVRKLRELASLGIDRFYVSTAARDAPPAAAREVHDRFVRDVLPQLRSGA
ncbi:LLM class flavin-dependent oxidoreductase [Saccharopolyspora sp. NPDC050642]|uniref:LLM class flavin-dependent oxidoreductase n=1 Tax=Saccharopolyspora sp. NPDC050642 TaxID=3157099 RepID=UPI0033EB34D5